MVTVCCVWVGEAFGVEYVTRLSDMVRRNLPEGFAGRFVCFTDRAADLEAYPEIETIDISQYQGYGGWWAKMFLFHPLFLDEGTRVWYFDLDTVITGPLEEIFNYPGAFAILRDAYRKWGLQSAVMSFIVGKQTHAIWEEWASRGRPLFPGGDQAVIEEFFRPLTGWRDSRLGERGWAPDILQEIYPGAFRSYKAECIWSVPEGTKVVFFHGVPRPHDVVTGWVPEVWRVGGGSSLELVTVGTVPQGQVLRNIRTALSKKYREISLVVDAHERIAVICGGGPSIASQLAVIGNLQSAGAHIFSLNNADGWLRRKNIHPEYHVMLDARPELMHWINLGGNKLYASMCAPNVLDLADRMGELKIWHAYTEGVDAILDRHLLIGGGGTVGTRALALAWVLGYRKMCVFGLDSCLSDDEQNHHAYAQPLNDGEPTFDCIVEGRKFRATAWMLKQVQEFKQLAGQLSAQDCSISVFGDHLLSISVAGMANSESLEVPVGDIEGIRSAMRTLKDLDHYVSLCAKRRVAVQAGGNVGVWANHLSRYFERVYTFEPDDINYAFLVRNTARHSTIICSRVALGEAQSSGALCREAGNSGATRIVPGSGVQIIALDSLHLDAVDLLQLDVEGFELQALKGARETIQRCWPLIVLELKGLGLQYGYEDDEVIEYLASLGYKPSGVAHRDVIFERKSA